MVEITVQPSMSSLMKSHTCRDVAELGCPFCLIELIFAVLFVDSSFLCMSYGLNFDSKIILGVFCVVLSSRTETTR